MINSISQGLFEVLDILFLTFFSQVYTEVAMTYWCGLDWP